MNLDSADRARVRYGRSLPRAPNSEQSAEKRDLPVPAARSALAARHDYTRSVPNLTLLSQALDYARSDVAGA